jgi:hypothetical protein
MTKRCCFFMERLLWHIECRDVRALFSFPNILIFQNNLNQNLETESIWVPKHHPNNRNRGTALNLPLPPKTRKDSAAVVGERRPKSSGSLQFQRVPVSLLLRKRPDLPIPRWRREEGITPTALEEPICAGVLQPWGSEERLPDPGRRYDP